MLGCNLRENRWKGGCCEVSRRTAWGLLGRPSQSRRNERTRQVIFSDSEGHRIAHPGVLAIRLRYSIKCKMTDDSKCVRCSDKTSAKRGWDWIGLGYNSIQLIVNEGIGCSGRLNRSDQRIRDAQKTGLGWPDLLARVRASSPRKIRGRPG